MFGPMFWGEKIRSHDNEYIWCSSHLRKIGNALAMYKFDYNVYPEDLAVLVTGGYAEELNVDSKNLRKNCFACPAQTSFPDRPNDIANWTTYIYRKPHLKRDMPFLVLHCLGYPHFRRRNELWVDVNDKFEVKFKEYNKDE